MALHCMWSRIRLTCIADNAKTVISLRSFFLVFYSVQYTHFGSHILLLALCLPVKYSLQLLLLCCADADSLHLYSNHILNYLLHSVDDSLWKTHTSVSNRKNNQLYDRFIHSFVQISHELFCWNQKTYLLLFLRVCVQFSLLILLLSMLFGWSSSIFHRWSNASHSSAEYEPICRRVWLFFSIFIITLSELRALLVDSQQIFCWRSIVWSKIDDRRHLYSTLIPCHLPTKSSTLNTFVSCIYMMKKMIFFFSNSPESAVSLHYNSSGCFLWQYKNKQIFISYVLKSFSIDRTNAST